jgi:uncharacterized RmlC-like cupin family protein
MTTSETQTPGTTPFWRRPLVRSTAADRTTDTPQTPGMRRFAAISGTLTGSQHLWMGGNTVPPGARSADHHHGEADSGIYVVSGHPRFVFVRDGAEQRIDAGPGDFVYVPAWVPHREENPSPDEEAIVVLARSTPEEIVVNLPDLWSLDGIPGASEPAG